MKYEFINYNREFNITNINNCTINIINVKFHNLVDNIPIFKAENFDKFTIVKISSGNNLILIGDELIKRLQEYNIRCLVWYMLINISFGMHEYKYDIQRDNIVDTYVANICGYKEYLETLNFIKTYKCNTEEQLNILNSRIRNVESSLVKNKQINVNTNKIIKNANLAFIKITDKEN